MDCERLQRRPPARNQHWADVVSRPQRVLTFSTWVAAIITAALGVLQTITGSGVLYIGLINLCIAAIFLAIPLLIRFSNLILQRSTEARCRALHARGPPQRDWAKPLISCGD